jgi:hypothetical protein
MFRFLSPVQTFVLAASLTVVACSGGSSEKKSSTTSGMLAPPSAVVGTPLAKVNGFTVGSSAFEVLSQRKTPADGQAFSTDEKREIVDLTVTDEVLFQEAFKKGLYHDPKVRKIMINLLLREEVYGKVSNDDFSDDDLTEYFGTHKEEFVVPEKVHVKRIFVAISNQRPAPEAESIAKALFAQVSGAPDTFRDVASESSDGPFKRRGGDLGYISDDGKPGIPSEVTNRAFKMEVGEISEPFLAAGGYNILSIPNRRERLERTFEQMRGSVLRRMKNDRYDSLSTEYVDTLEEGSAIEVMDAALENYTPIPNARPSMALPTGGLPSAVQPGALPVPIPDAALEGDEMAPSGEPRTGDPIRDLGDANDEAREMLEEALNEE